jgi:O-antigen/teichoic acid export membrane protein
MTPSGRASPARADAAGLANDRIARGAGGAFLLKVFEAGAAFLFSLLLGRLLGAHQYGHYAFTMAWVALLTVPALVGMENLTVRHVAGYRASGDDARLRGLLRFVVLAVSAASCLLAVAASTAAASGLLLPAGMALTTFVLGMALVPIGALTRIQQAATRGLHRVVEGFLPELVVTPVVTLALIGLLWLDPQARTGERAIALTVIAMAIALVSAVVILARRLPRASREVRPIVERRAWALTALPLLLIGGMQMVIRQTDVILLGLLVGPRVAGIYAVATRGSQFVSLLLYGVNAALAPNISRLYVAGQLTELQRIVTRSARAVLVISTPVAVALAVFGSEFLSLFGDEFREGAPALAILAVGQLINASTGSVGILLTMTGHERDAASGFVLSGVGNVLLNVALIPSLGATGAALANAASLTAWNVILALAVRRRLGIDSTALGRLGGRPLDTR